MSGEQPRREEKGGMPTWVKVLLIIIAVCVGGFFVLVGVGYFFYTSIVKNDPASAQQTVEKIVTFKQPLSKDYKYQLAVDADMFGTKFGVIEHEPDKSRFVIAQTTGSDKTVTTKQIVEQLQKNPRTSFTVIKESTANVGGKQFDYVVGKVGDSPQTTLPLMVGSLTLTQPQNHSVIVVESMEEPGNLDEKLTEEFLSNIGSLK